MDEVMEQDFKWMAHVVERLRKHFGRISWQFSNDAYKLLVATILSQNTSDVNSHRAFKVLEKAMEISPEVLARMPLQEIKEAIKSAGLANIKADRLRRVSQTILIEVGGDLSTIFNLPPEEARNFLLKLPGVGEKTADVVLVFGGGVPVVPVDTHLSAISRRLKLTNSSHYQEVKTAYEHLIPKKERAEAHLLFVELGKKYCKAIRPKHETCPIKDLCPTGLSSRAC